MNSSFWHNYLSLAGITIFLFGSVGAFFDMTFLFLAIAGLCCFSIGMNISRKSDKKKIERLRKEIELVEARIREKP